MNSSNKGIIAENKKNSKNYGMTEATAQLQSAYQACEMS